MTEKQEMKGVEEPKTEVVNETVTFVTNSDTLGISIRPPRIIVIDGEVVRKEGKRIEFNRETFKTSDKEEIDFLREFLKRPKDGTVITEIT